MLILNVLDKCQMAYKEKQKIPIIQLTHTVKTDFHYKTHKVNAKNCSFCNEEQN